MKRDFTIYEVKTKALISCVVTAQQICAFVFRICKNHVSSQQSSYIESRFLDGQACANNVDPDQTTPRGAILSSFGPNILLQKEAVQGKRTFLFTSITQTDQGTCTYKCS